MIAVRFRRRTWILIVIAGLLMLDGIWWAVSASPDTSAPRAHFQYYAPTQLPTGFSIKDKRIDAGHEDPQDHTINAYELNLRTEDWVYNITERKYYPDTEAESTTTTLSNYDPHSIGATCAQRTTPAHISYRLCHWADYGRISVFEIIFVKDGTYIETTFPTTLDKVIPGSELDRYVESFQKGDATGWRVLTGGI